MSLPRMFRIRQHFENPRVDDVAAATRLQLETLGLAARLKPGASVAVTAGSRGIANIDLVIGSIVRHLKDLGAKPFIVPAMGSHGGGTAQGQREIIEGYGVTEAAMGCPIRATMETVIVDRTPQGIPVHFDRYAYEADHVVVCNRVKPHTGFVGEIESGLHKMMLIGLGKHEGAKVYHRAIKDFSFGEIIHAVADVVLKKCKVLAGVAIVENSADETALIEAVPPERFAEREIALLKLARQWMPRLPFPDVDLLIIDRIGKNISGTGMDTNVVGRKYNDHVPTEQDDARVKRIFVRGLTPDTHGNATGIGIAEFTNRRTLEQIDHKITAVNCITGGHPTAAMIPIVCENDREAVESALSTLGLTPPDQIRVMQIANTLHLSEALVSEAYLDEARRAPHIEIVSEPEELPCDEQGNLFPVFTHTHAGH